MTLFLCILFAIIQNITAQAIAYAPRNGVPGENIINNHPQQIIANGNPMGPVPNNGLVRNMPNPAPNAVNNMPYVTNMANAQTPMNEYPIIGAKQEIVGANMLNANANPANGLANSNIALANSNLASINGNMATFNVGNGGFKVTSGSPGTPGFGIQVLADALEVGGMVAVNGQIPIFGAVTLNGQLPTDGSASVSYTCGGPTPLDGA